MMCIQQIQNKCRDLPEPVVAPAHFQAPLAGFPLAANGVDALGHDRYDLQFARVNFAANLACDFHSKPFDGELFILVLTARVLRLCGDAGRAVPQTHRRGNLVSVLSARARSLVCLYVALAQQGVNIQCEMILC